MLALALSVLSVLSANDVLAIPRLSDPRPSPDGRLVAFELGRVDPRTQALRSEIWAVAATGGEPRPLVQAGQKSHAPRWLRDGRLVYVSDVGGAPALWLFDPKNVSTRKLAALPDGLDEPVVSADLVLCAPVVAREAAEQGKPIEAHYAHLLVHGTLHAQGFDHEKARDTKAMEARETLILAALGFDDPYAA